MRRQAFAIGTPRLVAAALVVLLCAVPALAQERPEREEMARALQELRQAVERLQRQIDELRHEVREGRPGFRPAPREGDRPGARREAEGPLPELTRQIEVLERLIRERPDSPQAEEARRKLHALHEQREAMMRRLRAGRERPEARPPEKGEEAAHVKELEAHKQKLKEELQELGRAFRGAAEREREELGRKIEERIGELVRLHHRTLQHQAEMLEQQLRKVREELEQARERAPGMIEKIRKEILEK
jgi:uncharacterized protein YukE